MGLTQAEKTHFHTRIKERVAELSNQIIAEDPAWEAAVYADALKIVDAAFGVGAEMKALKVKNDKLRELEQQIAELSASIVAKMRGLRVGVDECSGRYAYRSSQNELALLFTDYPGDSSKIMRNAVERQFTSVQKSHPIGAKLLQLAAAQAELEDSITTAANHKQLHDVWELAQQKLGSLDGDTARKLRKVETSR